ncbi:MAG: hypothetical protein RL685_6648 [Pseudomonadota bacterium]|jgi:hypothetical protein
MRRIATIASTLVLLGSCATDENDPVPADILPKPAETVPASVPQNPDRAALVQAFLARPETARRLPDSESVFSQKMNLLQEDFLPLDERGLTRESTIIVRGVIEEVIDGRVIDFRVGASNPMLTSVLVVSVEKTIKGNVAAGDRLFVDVYRAPIVSSAELDATRPAEAVTLFLKPAYFDREILKYELNPAIEGRELLKLRTPQGLWSPKAEAIEQPLSGDPVFTDGVVRSQEQAEAAIEAIVAEGQ